MNPQLAFLLGKSLEYLRESNLEAAEPLLQQALLIEANNPDTLRFLGIIYAQRKDYSQALHYLDAAIKENPRNGMAHSNIGNVLFEPKYHCCQQHVFAHHEAGKYEYYQVFL